jgi:hypothetical protein
MSGIIKCLDNKDLSRRELLTGAGKVAAGIAVASAGGLSIVSGAEAMKHQHAKYPWPYKKLDPDKVAARAYENWYKHFCAYATAEAILGSLQEKVGEPYTSLPMQAFTWGHGGGVGWGMTCGTLMGSGMAAAFAAGKDGEKIINDVIQYYATTALPIYTPAKPKGTFKNVNKSDSPLCHVSVGRWMKKEGVKFFSPERKERCARLSADIAAETARLLNLWADGKYTPAHGSQAKTHGMTTQNNCGDCHSK